MLSIYEFGLIEAKDVDEVARLEAASYPEDEAASPERILYRSQYATPYFHVLKDKVNNSVVGFVNGTCVKEHYIDHESMSHHEAAGRTLVIHSVTVRATDRRKGIAFAMLTEYMKRVYATKTVDRMLLLCKGYLLPFYLKAGFQFICLSPVVHGSESWFECGVNLHELYALDQWQVDAFIVSGGFTGNPAAVVLVQKDEQWMQNVAMENNLAETSFLHKISDNRYHLRWFTPAKEVELCGHATLAAAHVLIENAFVDPTKPIVFETKCSGELIAFTLPDGKIELTFPATPASAQTFSDEERGWLKLALGVRDEDILFTGKSIYDTFVEISPKAFAGMKDINHSVLANFGGRGVLITTLGGKHTGDSSHPQYDFLSRCFFPLYGVNEDPVTGSAHCAIAPYWFHKLGASGTLVGLQASTRGGVLHLSLEGDKVKLAGHSITTMKSKLMV